MSNLNLFEKEKNAFFEQEKIVKTNQIELEKNKNILTALNNELAELNKKAQAKIDQSQRLSADEYVQLKNGNNEITARIEYYQALIEEQKSELQEQKETLLNLQRNARLTRSHILAQAGEEGLNAFLNEHKQTLAEIFRNLKHGGKFKQNPNFATLTEEQAIFDYIKRKLTACTDTELPLEPEFNLHSPFLVDFEPISPFKKHAQSFQQPQPKGFQALMAQFN